MSIEIIRDRSRRRDPFDFDGRDPNKAYRFVRDKDSNVEDRRRDGWDVVNASTRGREAVSKEPSKMSNSSTLDGTIRVRDTILMSMPREQFEEQYVKPHRKIVDDRTRGVNRQFVNEARSGGGRAIDETNIREE